MLDRMLQTRRENFFENVEDEKLSSSLCTPDIVLSEYYLFGCTALHSFGRAVVGKYQKRVVDWIVSKGEDLFSTWKSKIARKMAKRSG